jgi:hypothetical protein
MEQRNTQSAGHRSSQEFLYVLARLAEEVKQDWPFFSFCGFFVTAALVWRGQITAVTSALSGIGHNFMGCPTLFVRYRESRDGVCVAV